MGKKDIPIKDSDAEQRIVFPTGFLLGDITVRTLLESLAEGVVVINKNRRIIFINKRMTAITGFTSDEVIGRDLNIFIPHQLTEKHNSHVKRYMKVPQVRPMGLGLNLMARRKDDTIFPVEISLSSLPAVNENLVLAFVTDISARKKAEQELEKRNIELDAYAHTVAHDLNSMLNTVVGYSELLFESADDFPKKQTNKFLKEIASSARKMSTIVNELLVFASIKKEDIHFKKVVTRNVIEAACRRLRILIVEKDADIVIGENILNCMGQPIWVEEVFYNFISNALKYCSNKPQIEIFSEKTENGFVRYSIKDNGDGMSAEQMELIFQETAVGNEYVKGYGFGLAIVKRIVEKLDGTVTVKSESGKGSVFSFYLKELIGG